MLITFVIFMWSYFNINLFSPSVWNLLIKKARFLGLITINKWALYSFVWMQHMVV